MDAKFYMPYETARELRLKGYPQSTDTWYVETAKGVRTYKKQSAEYESIARPTYHEVLDWLFNMGWFVWARNYDNEVKWFSVFRMKPDSKEHFPHGVFYSREDALNAAILETLKRL